MMKRMTQKVEGRKRKTQREECRHNEIKNKIEKNRMRQKQGKISVIFIKFFHNGYTESYFLLFLCRY